MIKDSIDNAGLYAAISPRLAQVFDFIRAGGLDRLANGRHDIDGDDLYVNVQRNALKDWPDGRWEAHNNYADVQYVRGGAETIGFCDRAGLVSDGGYDSGRDIEFFAAADGARLVLRAGDFAVFFPRDAHKPNTLAPDSVSGAEVDVAVFKIRL